MKVPAIHQLNTQRACRSSWIAKYQNKNPLKTIYCHVNCRQLIVARALQQYWHLSWQFEDKNSSNPEASWSFVSDPSVYFPSWMLVIGQTHREENQRKTHEVCLQNFRTYWKQPKQSCNLIGSNSKTFVKIAKLSSKSQIDRQNRKVT